jgi:sodium/bile acid cotransporter 7
MFKKLLPDPFLVLLLVTVATASFFPAQGMWAELVGWGANLAVVLLFFFHGAKLERSAVLAGLTHWRLHILIMAFTFVLFPLLGIFLAKLFPYLISAELWTGVLFLCALPSTVQSSIAFVSIAGGNIPSAIAAASASQILGVFLTPLLVSWLTSNTNDDNSSTIQGILLVGLLIILPFLVGQLFRPWIAEFVHRHKKSINYSDRTTIILAVYTAFSAAVLEGIWDRISSYELTLLTGICCFLLMILLVITRLVSRAFGFTLEDEIVIVFCGTKKSLVQGAPMAKVLFAGPQAGLILLPIMIFHQIQLMVCAWLAKRYAKLSTEVSSGEN